MLESNSFNVVPFSFQIKSKNFKSIGMTKINESHEIKAKIERSALVETVRPLSLDTLFRNKLSN